jgi:quinoprotein glucose dehydrogenase
MNHKFVILTLVLCTIGLYHAKAQSRPAAKISESWPAYGGDAGGTRYSSLNQIKRENVKDLKVAWTYQTRELAGYAGTKTVEKAAFEATPVLVDGMLYFSTPSCRVIALDATTGKEKWVFNPKVDLKKDFSEITSRGVSAWPFPGDKVNTKYRRRIFIATIDGRLIALDAQTGKPVNSFGQNGTVDLRKGFGEISVTSPPAVIGNMLVVGSSLGDNQRFNYERGTVRAYDAITGQLKWSWDPIPQNEADPGWETWKGPKAHQTGAANAWSVISADPERDLVFIPTTCPSPDYYGGERLGKNLYASSMVALQASSGKLVWHYQTVHHDLWDYDNAAQPVLLTVLRQGKATPAVAVGTKMGFIFILHRETGLPLFPVEERPVPQSTIPAEEAYPTQPFPLLPPPLGLHHVSPEDAWGLTPQEKEAARKRIASLRNEGMFTPPSQEGSLIAPGNVGGIHWGGMCYNTEDSVLITNVNRLAAIITMLPREKVEQAEQERKELLRAETGWQEGTPYVMKREYLFTGDDRGLVMQTSPPWGTLAAIHVNTGKLVWEVPLGYMLDPDKYPQAREWGSLNLGGAITTGGGLIFVAATRDNHLRAFDTKTGKLLWEELLPASGQATPMTYLAGNKQFVVIAAGGHGKFKTTLGDYIVAFSLPAAK